MGYAAVLWLDDRTVRHAEAIDIGEDLWDLVGGNTYPSGGLETRTKGVWSLVGTWHSSAMQMFHADGQGLHLVSVGDDLLDGFGLVDEVTLGVAHQRTVELMRDGRRLMQARSRGQDPRDLVLGMQVQSVASLWWVYLDTCDRRPDLVAVGEWVKRCVDRLGVGGLHGDVEPWTPLQRGVLVTPGAEGVVVWSQNRLCTPGALGGPERQRLEERALTSGED